MFELLMGPLKRLLVFAITAGLLALNKKFGLELDASAIAGIVALTVLYILQSAWRQGKDLKPETLPAIAAEALKKAEAEVKK